MGDLLPLDSISKASMGGGVRRLPYLILHYKGPRGVVILCNMFHKFGLFSATCVYEYTD